MVDPTLNPAELSKRGIAAARAGRNDEAREYLMAAVEADEHNEQAWLWLGGLMPELEDKIVCLENALTINPDNEPAARKLQQLQAKRATFSSTPPAAESETVANPPATMGSSSAPPPTATQDLYLNSPAATQGLPEPPLGTLPWDHLVTPFSADTGSLSAAGNDYRSGATIARPPLDADTDNSPFSRRNAGEGATLSRPPLGAGDTAVNPFGGYRGGYADIQTSSGYGNPPTGDWSQPGTQHMGAGWADDSDQPADQYAPEYRPGGHPEQRGGGGWEHYEGDYTDAPSGFAAANPFTSSSASDSYHPYDSSPDASTPTHDSQRYAGAGFNPNFILPPEQLEHDERFDCPYCGWQTRPEDQRCPNCGGDLYISARTNDKRSGALMLVVLMWVVRALYGVFNLGLAIILTSILATQLSSGIDPAAAARYGLTPTSISAATRSVEIILAIIYGVQIAAALIMAIGSWMRLRIFYYLNLGVLGLLALFTIFTFAIDPVKSPITLIIGLAILIAQFLLVFRADSDFGMQKERIVEPSYHGEASALGFYNLGTRYQKAGFTALAAKAWRRAVSLSPGDARTRSALARAYNKMKRYDLAAQELAEVLRIDPADTRAVNLMAIAQMRLGNYDEARRYVARALEAKPDDPDTLDNQKLIEDEIKKATAMPSAKPAPAAQGTKKVTG